MERDNKLIPETITVITLTRHNAALFPDIKKRMEKTNLTEVYRLDTEHDFSDGIVKTTNKKRACCIFQ